MSYRRVKSERNSICVLSHKNKYQAPKERLFSIVVRSVTMKTMRLVILGQCLSNVIDMRLSNVCVHFSVHVCIMVKWHKWKTCIGKNLYWVFDSFAVFIPPYPSIILSSQRNFLLCRWLCVQARFFPSKLIDTEKLSHHATNWFENEYKTNRIKRWHKWLI